MGTITKNILIIDDEKALANALQIKLTSSGFDTQVAYEGQTALEFLKKGGFDLVLLDIMMPNVNGYDVLKYLKESDVHIPVIVCSNLGEDKDLEKAKQLGASDFFIKSETPLIVIVNKINELLKA